MAEPQRKLAIIAALPREISGLVRGAPPDQALKARGILLYKLPTCLAVAAGMGHDRAALAIEAALANSSATALLSAGLAGACSGMLKPGSIAEATEVIDARTGERYGTNAPAGGQRITLATDEQIAGVQEKARLAATYNAAMVDMEAATVARLARAHGLSFRAVKGISDAHDFELEGLSRFAGKQGEFRTAAFALHTALRPGSWRKAIELGKGSSLALKALTAELQSIIAGEA